MLEAGHYEIDTIYGKDQESFLLTLVDIATMYTVIIKLDNKAAKTVEDALIVKPEIKVHHFLLN
jgi:IS30 family transposase